MRKALSRASASFKTGRPRFLTSLLRGLRASLPVVLPILLLAFAAAAGLLVWQLTTAGQPPIVVQIPYPATTIGSTSAEGGGNEPQPVGSGEVSPNRDQDFTHVVEQGETLSEIAYRYDIDFSKLAIYNNLANPNAIHPGQKIIIPSLANLAAIKLPAVPPVSRPTAPASSAERLRIVDDSQSDGRSVTAHFSVGPGQNLELVSYEWDLGDGRKSFRETTYWTYDKPGTYTVQLKATDGQGRQYLSNQLFVNVPYPGTSPSDDQRFVTLPDVGEPFDVPGDIIDVLGYGSLEEASIVQAGEENGIRTYAANASGFFNLTLSSAAGELSRLFLFVSPVPSVHNDRADVDWYRTQFNTGRQSNCGPSVVSMAVGWAKGQYLPVATVRQYLGWEGDGGIGFEDMRRALVHYGVNASIEPVTTPDDVIALIDSGSIVALLYNTVSVKRASGDPLKNLFGAYYTDNVGHYVVVKGYSKDRQWLIVYDPIPSDWSANSLRYDDGISMIGKNRYYPTRQLFATLRRQAALVVSK